MKCPMCGTNTQIDFSYCPLCGFKVAVEVEPPLPNWRKLPGFRSKTLWKTIAAAILYIWILLAIVASLFSVV